MLPVSHFVYQLLPWKTNDTEKGVTLSIRVRSKVEMQVVTFVFLCDVIVGVTSASPSVSLRKRFTDHKESISYPLMTTLYFTEVHLRNQLNSTNQIKVLG